MRRDLDRLLCVIISQKDTTTTKRVVEAVACWNQNSRTMRRAIDAKCIPDEL
jgi:uncharacterized protein with von Willebrand factor type A (vWA) domain